MGVYLTSKTEPKDNRVDYRKQHLINNCFSHNLKEEKTIVLHYIN